MQHFEYKTHGTCSSMIIFDLDGTTIHNVRFINGCSGNTQGVAALAEGQQLDTVIARLRGIRCGSKATSCPDQLACALSAVKDQL